MDYIHPKNWRTDHIAWKIIPAVLSFILVFKHFLGLYLFVADTHYINAAFEIFSSLVLLLTILVNITQLKWIFSWRGLLLRPRSWSDFPFLTVIFITIHVALYYKMIEWGGLDSWIMKDAFWHMRYDPTSWKGIYLPALLNFPPPLMPNHEHLKGNMLSIATHGLVVELSIGRLGYLFLWLLVPWTQLLFNFRLGLGTSGITFSFVGAAVGSLLIVRMYDINRLKVEKKIIHIFVSLMLFVGGSMAFLGMLDANIGHDAHAKGMICGFFFALAWGFVVYGRNNLVKNKFIGHLLFPQPLICDTNDEDLPEEHYYPSRDIKIDRKRGNLWIFCWSIIGIIGLISILIFGVLTDF